ncbi:MAG: hypothetical protein ACREPZ_02220 [Rhodanobacteraceae bacterium]
MRRRTQTVTRARRSAGTRRSHRQPFRHGTATATVPARLTGARTLRRAQPDPITLGAGTWFACGIVLLGLTPLPLREAHLGWSFTFWALAAPLLVLLAHRLRPRLS